MISSTFVDVDLPPPGAMPTDSGVNVADASGVSNPADRESMGEGQPSCSRPGGPDAVVGWLLLHAKQHMQGRY